MYVKSKAKTSSEIELQELITEWAYGMSFFERWQERSVRSVREISAGIGKLTADTDAQLTQVKLDWLREQIEMRTRGLQWVDFATRWSSTLDSGVGTVGDLTGHLKELVEEEQERRAAGELPEAAPAPVSKRKTFKELGTPTAQAEELALQRVELTPEELRVKAEIERDRLEAIGEIDTVADQQPEDAPSFSSLPTRRVEVRWWYYVKDATRKSGRRTEYIWTGGEVQHANPSSRIAPHRIASHRIPSHPVSSHLIPSHPVPSRPIPSHPNPTHRTNPTQVVEIADGKTTKKTPKCKDPLPWGAVRIRFPEDADRDEAEHFAWAVLKPDDWRKERHNGWRYDPAELVKLRAARLSAGKRKQCDV